MSNKRPVVVLPRAVFEAMAGEAVAFDWSQCFDPDGTLSAFIFTSGEIDPMTGKVGANGVRCSLPQFEYRYAAPGVYHPTITALDGQGLPSLRASFTVLVAGLGVSPGDLAITPVPPYHPPTITDTAGEKLRAFTAPNGDRMFCAAGSDLLFFQPLDRPAENLGVNAQGIGYYVNAWYVFGSRGWEPWIQGAGFFTGSGDTWPPKAFEPPAKPNHGPVIQATTVLDLSHETPEPRPNLPATPAGVLSVSRNLRFVRRFFVPKNGAWNAGYSDGAIAFADLGGQPRLLMVGRAASAGGGRMPIGVFTIPTDGQNRGELVDVLDWYRDGDLPTQDGNQVVVRGLLFDPISQLIGLTYHSAYNVGGMHDPAIVWIDPFTRRVVYRGRTTADSHKVCGPLVQMPSELHPNRFGVWGPPTPGNAASYRGLGLNAFALPSLSRQWANAGDGVITMPSITLAYSDARYPTPQPVGDGWLRCGWSNYDNPAAVPNPQANPIQGPEKIFDRDGRCIGGGGCNANGEFCGLWQTEVFRVFSELCMLTAGAWIQTPAFAGLLMIGQVVTGRGGPAHKSYMPQNRPGQSPLCAHGIPDGGYGNYTGDTASRMEGIACVLSAADLMRVARGELDPTAIRPHGEGLVSLNTIQGMPADAYIPTIYHYQGAAADNPRRRLYVSEVYGETVFGNEPGPSVIEFEIVE